MGPERIVAGLDARDGLVRVHGWQESTPLRAVDLAKKLKAAGLCWLIFTDIAQDGWKVALTWSRPWLSLSSLNFR